MKPLPFPITDPLHILPWWLSLIKWAFVLFLLYLIIRYLYKKLRPYFYRLMSLLTRENRKADIGKRTGKIDSIIKSIKIRNLKKRTYRRGLFELSEEMKTFLEKQTGVHVEEMTAYEIGSFFSSEEPGRFFRVMEELEFGEKEPEWDDLVEMCGRAEKLAKIKLKRERGVTK